jgi:hypothetical protein
VVAVADFEEDAGEVFHGGDAEGADAVEDVAVGVGGLAADDDGDFVREETAEADHLVGEVWVVGRVDDAEGDGADVVHDDGSDDFFCWEGGAEVGDVPAGFASEACGDGGTHFVELSGWGADEESGGGFRGIDWAEGPSEVVFDGAGGAVFLGGGDFAAEPVCAETMEEGNEDTLEHAGVAHGEHGVVEGAFEGRDVVGADGFDGALGEGGGVDWGGEPAMWEGSAGEVAEAVDHGAEFRGGEACDLADVEAGAGESGEHGEPVDFFVVVEAALGEAATGLDGGVAFLPHADKVRAEPCAEGDGLHVVERFHGSGRGERGRVEGVEKRSVRDGMAGCKYGPARDDC